MRPGTVIGYFAADAPLRSRVLRVSSAGVLTVDGKFVRRLSARHVAALRRARAAASLGGCATRNWGLGGARDEALSWPCMHRDGGWAWTRIGIAGRTSCPSFDRGDPLCRIVRSRPPAAVRDLVVRLRVLTRWALGGRTRPTPGIVIGTNIGGIYLGMERSTVRTRLGPPALVARARPRFVADRPVVRYHYPRYGLAVDFGRGRSWVWRVSTGDRRYRTDDGLGVGSSEQAVRAALPREVCRIANGHGYCTMREGDVVYLYFRRGSVSSVAVQVTRAQY